MARGLGTTPWADAVIDRILDEIEANVKPAFGPRARTPEGYEEYGCGYFGCVFPTATENVVLKITSDAREAMFVQTVLEGDQDETEGLVRYHAVRRVHGASRTTIERGTDVFAIWREEIRPYTSLLTGNLKPIAQLTESVSQVSSAYTNADSVTKWFALLHAAAAQEEAARAALIERQRGMADFLGEKFDPNTLNEPYVLFYIADSFAEQAAKLAQVLVWLDQTLRRLPSRPPVLDALRVYYERGWLFPDVMADNLGFRTTYNGGVCLIDPSMAIPLRVEHVEALARIPTIGRKGL